MIEALYPDRRGKAEDNAPEPGSAWAGKIASAPDDGEVEVTLSGYSKKHRFGPCPYMPRAATNPDDPPDEPARGDKALVVFDDDNEPWVVCWKPA